MNALVYHVASGQAFFSGVALITLSVLLARVLPGRVGSFFRTVFPALGLILIAASATPLPLFYYAASVTLTTAWIIFDGSAGPRWLRSDLRTFLRGATLAAWWLEVGLELPYHQNIRLPPLGRTTVYVVGDSLSAGMGGNIETWPKILARRRGVVVRDLSLAGANVDSAWKQAEAIEEPGSLVVAEIGGNDVLGETTPEVFERRLDRLLARLRQGSRTVVLLELPLPPFFNRFGAVQRRLARRHGVYLVPKRLLLAVLTTKGATLDTIHLSRFGQDRMADAIWSTIRGAFAPEEHHGPSR